MKQKGNFAFTSDDRTAARLGPGTNNPPDHHDPQEPIHEPIRTPNEQHDMEKEDKIHESNDTSETATLQRTKTQEQIDDEKRDEEITHLARRYTSQSHHSAYTKNPFEEREKDGEWENSVLNPASPHFKPRAFAKSLLNLQARDPEKWKQRTAGFAFKDLSVFGFGSGTDYQKDVVSGVQLK